jgi:folate-binding protein YgfZ
MLLEYYKAARESAALVEEDWYGVVKLTGTERVTWLQGMVSNDVQILKPGSGCYAAHLTPQGKIVAHMVILKDEDCLWLILERAMIPKLIAGFDKLLIMEDVQVSDEAEHQQILGVVGPKAQTVLEAWLGENLQIPDLYSHRTIKGHRIIRTNLGYDIWAKRETVDSSLRALAENGAVAIDRGTWDVLRTELGWPIFGVDIDETTTLPELGEHAISYDKGCYVGQEVVAKVKYIGHVNRRFVGLIMTGETLAEMKSPIRKADKEVGYVTTSLFSPGLQKSIALGFVARTAYAPGTEVEVLSEGKSIPAKIVELPFTTAASDL